MLYNNQLCSKFHERKKLKNKLLDNFFIAENSIYLGFYLGGDRCGGLFVSRVITVEIVMGWTCSVSQFDITKFVFSNQ